MNAIQPVTLQSLSTDLGHEAAIRYCAPLSFYMILRALGVLPNSLMPGTFCADLDKAQLTVGGGDWSRPALSRYIRETYKVPVVSWQLQGEANIELMKKAGYIETAQEERFFKDNIYGRSVKEIVQSGYPVIVTMEPGFGTEDNKNIHALIIVEWKDGLVTLVDPDARNERSRFDEDRVLQYLSPAGGGSVILPPSL